MHMQHNTLGLTMRSVLLFCWQAQCSARLQGRAAVLVSASTAVSPSDLAAQPLASYVIRTYNGTNRYGKQLYQMKAYIGSSGNFRSEDEKRICLAIAMQVGCR